MEKFVLPNIDEEKTVLKTIRIKSVTLKKVEELSIKTNISINRIINESIEYALNNFDESTIVRLEKEEKKRK